MIEDPAERRCTGSMHNPMHILPSRLKCLANSEQAGLVPLVKMADSRSIDGACLEAVTTLQ